MWWCAELVYPGRFFDRYALLGDEQACSQSVCLLVRWVSGKGEICWVLQSLLNGFGWKKDLSPVSVKHLNNWFHPYGIMVRYNFPFQLACRLIFGWVSYKPVPLWSPGSFYDGQRRFYWLTNFLHSPSSLLLLELLRSGHADCSSFRAHSISNLNTLSSSAMFPISSINYLTYSRTDPLMLFPAVYTFS